MWSSLPCSQQPATFPALSRISPVHALPLHLRSIFNIITPPTSRSSRWFIPTGFITKTEARLFYLSVRPSKQCFRDTINCQQCKGKGKGHPRTGHKGQEGEKMYSSTLPSTSALDGVGSQRHAPAALPRERPGTHCIGGWVGTQGPVWPPSEFDPRTIQTVASRYTDGAIAAV